jgi:hypothetical protein
MTIHEGPVGAEALDLSCLSPSPASLALSDGWRTDLLSCSFSLKHREGLQACALRLGRILLRLGPLGLGSSLKGRPPRKHPLALGSRLHLAPFGNVP